MTEGDRVRDTGLKGSEGRAGEEGGGRRGLYLAWRKRERSQKVSAAVITLN